MKTECVTLSYKRFTLLLRLLRWPKSILDYVHTPYDHNKRFGFVSPHFEDIPNNTKVFFFFPEQEDYRVDYSSHGFFLVQLLYVYEGIITYILQSWLRKKHPNQMDKLKIDKSRWVIMVVQWYYQVVLFYISWGSFECRKSCDHYYRLYLSPKHDFIT